VPTGWLVVGVVTLSAVAGVAGGRAVRRGGRTV
jgi:hypothetical protein